MKLIPETWRDELGKIIRFGLVGLLNTALTLGTIYLLQHILEQDYRLANFIGYAVGIINSFILNRSWTFKSQDTRITRQGVLFLAVAGVCYLIQYGVLNLLVEVLEVDKDLSHLLGMVVYTGINYLANRLIVFNKPA